MLGVAVEYIGWHYSAGIADALRVWGNFLWFFYSFFSIRLLLGTLFSPFQRLTEEYKPGLRPGEWAETFLVNVLMRIVGAVIRLFLITIGLVALLATLGFGALLFAAWLAAPLVMIMLLITGSWLLIS